MRILSFSLVLAAFLVAPVAADYLSGDLNRDNAVNIQDLVLFAGYWLDAGCSSPECEADLDGVAGVDGADFALLAENWGVGPLVINEFLASNNSWLEDPDEADEYPDWIELYNPSCNGAIDLGGMYLTDDLAEPTRWQIPEGVSIEAGGYLLFWADDDDEQGDTHTNFQLDKAGEEIGLFDPNGVTLIDSISFDNQIEDWSLGRYPNGSGKWMIMPSPTPGYANNVGLSVDVEFSRAGGIITTGFSLELTTDSGNADIYYTLGGSEPNYTTGTLYTGPISISNCKRVRARAYEAGLLPGPVHSEGYLFLAPDVLSFSSNMPVVVVDSFGYDIDSECGDEEWNRPWYPFRSVYSVFIDVDTAGDGRADITDVHDFAGRAGMKVRGNSSQISPKKQYRLETWDEYDEDKNVSILDFPSEADWAFHAPYGDKTLMRNYLAYKWGNELGRYATRTRFCEMFFNWQDDIVDMSDYQGVYLFMEKIKRDKNRVDITRLEPTDNSEPEISGGYIMKVDVVDEDETGFQTSHGNPPYWDWNAFIHVYPDADDITSAQETWIRGYIEDFEDALYGPDFDDPVVGYPAYIDASSFMDYHFLSEVLMNADSFYASVYMYKDRGRKMNMGPIWDWNVSMGGTSDWGCDYAWSWDYGDPGDWWWLCDHVDTFWFSELSEDPAYRQFWVDRWAELRLGLLATDSLLAEVDATAAYLNEAQARNFTRWPILGQWVEPGQLNPAGYAQRDTYQKEVDYLKDWLGDRLAWIESHFLPLPQLSHEGGQVPEGFSLTMTVPPGATKIYYTVDGSDPHEKYSVSEIISQSTLVTEDAGKTVLVPSGDIGTIWRSDTAYDDSTWTHGTPTVPDTTGGVGYERYWQFYNYITYDVEGEMYGSGKNTTCYVRIAFTVDAQELANYNFMTLKMRYDDGFVAYINGQEVARAYFTGTPSWDSFADSDERESGSFQDFDVSAYIGELSTGLNILAIHGLNRANDSSDFLVSAELIAGQVEEGTGGGISQSAIEYTAPITLTENTFVKARSWNGSWQEYFGGLSSPVPLPWSGLKEARFAVTPATLVITEIMYHPPDPNHEYIELKNIGSEPINLKWVSFDNGIYFTFPSMQLNPCQYIIVVKNPSQFEAEYGTGANIAGQFTGSLDNAGEKIELVDATGMTILDFQYEDNWFDITDGDGFSLTVRDPNNADPNDWDDKKTWRPSAAVGGSPGWDDTGVVPELGAVVINELLAHSHAQAPDWIELYNTTSQPINIGGWFLSDSDVDDPNRMKYEIAEGTVIDPNGYVAFYEDQHFGNKSDTGCHEPFALSENGETLYLQSGQSGVLTGYYDDEKFDASETNVAFGRYYKASTGTYNFVAMSANTPGAANAYPKVGPIVISEIMYHPRDPNLGSPYTDDDDFEYVELHNITTSPVTLQEYDNELQIDVGWRFTDEDESIDFIFPLGTTVPPGGYLVLVKDEDAFNYRYTVPGGVGILEWGDGKCNNGGEKINLQMPGDMVGSLRYYIRIDRVNYSDGSHPENFPGGVDPWPPEPDGGGKALTRKVATDYGNDVANWQAARPTPGH